MVAAVVGHESPCVKCGSAVERDGKGHRRCPVCRATGRAAANAKRTAEQRRTHRQRAADRVGKRYTPGVKPWEAPKSRFGRVAPSGFVDSRWRSLEIRNAIDAWRWWLAHA